MTRRIIAAVAVVATLTACERRPAGGADQVESGASPVVTDTVGTGQQTTGGDTAAPAPGFSGMERDTSGADTGAARSGKLDSFRLKQETGQDTGGYSGAERGKPGKDTAR
jgi:hypothetical protein